MQWKYLDYNYIQEFIEKNSIRTCHDVLAVLPRYMLHIWQEPELLNTYRKRNNPDSTKKPRKTYFENKIKNLTVSNYFRFFIHWTVVDWECLYTWKEGKKIVCTCKEMAEVAAVVVSFLLKKPVYIIWNCRPLYVKGHNSKKVYNHYFNAYFEHWRVVFFDTSVYKHIFDYKKDMRVKREKTNFLASDIYKDQIFRDWFLQTKTNEKWFEKRVIKLCTDDIHDTWAKKTSKQWYFFDKIQLIKKKKC